MSDPIDIRRRLQFPGTGNSAGSPEALLTKQSLALLKAFYTIEDPELRHRIVLIVEAMAKTGSASAQDS